MHPFEGKRQNSLEAMRSTLSGPSYLLPHIRAYRTSRSDKERQQLFQKVSLQAHISEQEAEKELVTRAKKDQRLIEAEARGWILCLVAQGLIDADHAGAELMEWAPGSKYNP